MNIGDKVRVLALEGFDGVDTDLEVGSEGIIIDIDEQNVCLVDFGNIMCSGHNSKDNGYYMYKGQLEVIEGGMNL